MKFILTCILSIFLTAAFASDGGNIKVKPGKNAAIQLSFASVSKKETTAVITVRDMNGKIISQKNIKAVFGENITTIGNAGTMSEGNYIIKINIGTSTLQTNFTVWK